MSETLMDKLLNGTAFLEDIDDWVDRWHDDQVEDPIWKFLGMTRSEYGLWVEQPDALRFIVAAREQDRPVDAVLATYESRELVAARSEDADQALAVTKWLRRTGRLT